MSVLTHLHPVQLVKMATELNNHTAPSPEAPIEVAADAGPNGVMENGLGGVKTDEAVVEVDPEVQPFEVTVRFPPRPVMPKSAADTGPPATADPFKMVLNPHDSLSEVRMLISDGPDGYWLGAFCFCLPSQLKTNGFGKQAVQTTGKRLDEFVELKEIFKDVQKGEEEVVIVHTPFNEADARGHIQRVHNLITSGLNDPSTIAVDSGISVRDAVQSPDLWLAEGMVSKNSDAATRAAEEKLAEQAKAVPFANFESTSSSHLLDFLPPQARSPRDFPTCLRQLSISAWSPPPHHLRRQGHLLYVQVVTLENETHIITSSTTGFYVNKSTLTRFDPSPRSNGADYASSSLIDLLCALSPSFLSAFGGIFREPISERDFHAVVPISNQLPAAPWLARTNPHVADLARTQMAYIITGAVSTETLESTRDWHEEFCSARELPKGTVSERMWRDRLLSRTQAELTMAAARAVPKVAAGEAMALNPADKPEAQMYLINNLFITKGVDSLGMFPHVGSDEAAHVIVGKDAQNVRILNALDVEGLTTLGTVVVDWLGERWIVQTVVPGLFRQRDHGEEEEEDSPPTEQAEDHENVNAEKPRDIQEDPRDQFTYRYGSVESPLEIRSDKQFHALFGQIGQALRLAEHEVPDGNDNKHSLWLSVECKGLHGSDGRKYIHDIARLMPVDVEWLEKDVDGPFLEIPDEDPKEEQSSYPHQIVLLRPELLDSFFEFKIRAWAQEKVTEIRAKNAASKPTDTSAGESEDAEKKDDVTAKLAAATKEAEEEQKALESIDISEFKLTFNPDAFVAYRLTSSQGDLDEDAPVRVLVSDESDPAVAAVRSASIYMRETVIPQLVQDVISGAFTVLDGAALSRHMHSRGINMRYLGRIAQASTDKWVQANVDGEVVAKAGGHEGFIKILRTVASQEMVVRASKRILRSLLKGTPADHASNVIAHFLNCLLGTAVEPSPLPEYRSTLCQPDGLPPAWTQLTPASLAAQVRFEVKRRFRFILPNDYLTTVKRERQILRDLCYRCGIQLKFQEYNFDTPIQSESRGDVSEDSHGEGSSSAPVTTTKTAKKKKKAAAKLLETEPKARRTTFVAEDIINLVPILKEAGTKSSAAEQTFETGRQAVTRGEQELGAEFLMQGVQFYEQVYGNVHAETGRAFAQYVSIAQHFGTLAVLQQNATIRKAQADGADLTKLELPQPHPELNLETALRFQQHAVTIFERTLGMDHNETIQQWTALANLQRLMGSYEAALRSLNRILHLCTLAYGSDDHPETIQVLSSAGQALRDDGRTVDSLALYKAAHESALRLFGADAVHTANLAHELMQALLYANDFTGALAIEKTANAVFEKRLGPDDPATVESQRYLLALTKSAVVAAKQQKEIAKKGLPGAQSGAHRMAVNGSRPAVQQTRAARPGQAAASPLRSVPANGQRSAITSHTNGAPAEASAVNGKTIATVDPNLSIDDLVDYIQGAPASKANKKKKGGGASSRLQRA